MSTYYPDKWIVIKIIPNENPRDTHYRVFGTWKGSYATSDTWRLNSGITQVEYDLDLNKIKFYGSTGSCYNCHSSDYGVSWGLQADLDNILDYLKDKAEVEILPEDTNWTEVDYNN